MVNISTNSINSECCGFAPNIEYIFQNDRCTIIAIIAKTTWFFEAKKIDCHYMDILNTNCNYTNYNSKPNSINLKKTKMCFVLTYWLTFRTRKDILNYKSINGISSLRKHLEKNHQNFGLNGVNMKTMHLKTNN